MAETRKHHVDVRDELDRALYAATHPTTGAGEPEPAASDTPRPTSAFVAPGSPLARFTFGPSSSSDQG